MINEVAGSVFSEEIYRIGKKTFVITSDPWEQIAESDRALLEKILQAVGLTIAAVVIAHQPALSVDNIRLRAARVIYFGDNRNDQPLYEVATIEDIPVIYSAPLKALQTDAASKAKFWAALKLLFSR